jgi:hypothetical protein
VDRAALDEFFAKAEDVLTDWNPSGDAMIAKVPDSDDIEALPGDSYYEQHPPRRWQPIGILDVLAVGAGEWADIGRLLKQAYADARNVMINVPRRGGREQARRIRLDDPIPPTPQSRPTPELADVEPTDPRERALWRRRRRNTGPDDPWRIDGRRRRS